MDYGSILVSLLIAAWGVYEYERRKEAHSRRMSLLQRGETPAEQIQIPAPHRLFTSGLVCLALAAFVTGLLIDGWRPGTNAGHALRIFGFALIPPLVVLLLIVARDARALMRVRRAKEVA